MQNFIKGGRSPKRWSNRISIRNLTYGSLTIALVLVTTFAIKIPIPFTQGYIHPGDSMIFITAILFGWRFGALAGGIGSAMADLLGGYAHWAIPTLIIKAIMGGLVGWVGHDLLKLKKHHLFSSLLTAGAIIAWVGFNFGIQAFLTKAMLSETSLELTKSLELTQEELILLIQKTNFWLSITAIAIPIGIIILAYYLKKWDKNLFNPVQLLGMFMAGLWMVVGYYLAGSFIYGSFIVPILSIPANIVQFIGGLVIAYLILIPLKKIGFDNYFGVLGQERFKK
ncbi:MAG: ECF transporter S component [Bacillota bacterium]